jgi:hypothetical protein
MFVHYTSAEAALNIISHKRIWMRNATSMSDYREVQHGLNLLRLFWANRDHKQRFEDAINPIAPHAIAEATSMFDNLLSNVLFNTYITSFAEHHASENRHGRLSMWRAFGGAPSRVAIVFRLPWFGGRQNVLRTTINPVLYPPEQSFPDMLLPVAEKIRENADFLKSSLTQQEIAQNLLAMFVTLVTCIKHEGFHEEREWRVIYWPRLDPSHLMESGTELVGGVPQTVYKIPLDAGKSPDLAPVDLNVILDRLIIGPSQFGLIMADAFRRSLEAIGVTDAANRVVVSGIPIRS